MTFTKKSVISINFTTAECSNYPYLFNNNEEFHAIYPSTEDLEMTVLDLLNTYEDKLSSNSTNSSEDNHRDKIILFNAFTPDEVIAIIRKYKDDAPDDSTIFAFITPNSINWKLSDLIAHLKQERNERIQSKKQVS